MEYEVSQNLTKNFTNFLNTLHELKNSTINLIKI